MTPTHEQIIAEANRRAAERGYGAPLVEDFIIEIVREGWKPPEPPVDPDLLAFREWARGPHALHPTYQDAYLAGARMATERERERAKVLLEYVQDDADIRWPSALAAIAKYEEGKK